MHGDLCTNDIYVSHFSAGWKLLIRTKRLQSLRAVRSAEEQLRMQQLKQTNDPQYATLIGG